MASPAPLAAALAALVLCAACGRVDGDGTGAGSFPLVKNPTGACGTRTDGARAGYATDGFVWVPDCECPLAREYWRVYTKDGARAFFLPRPDGAPELAEPCADPKHALHAVVVDRALCAAASSAAEVARVNDVALADALRVTHFLHGHLRFATTKGGIGIAPFPLPSDIVDACALHPESSKELEAMCQRERDRIATGNDIGFTYEGPGAVELVGRLNELCGVE